MARVAAAHMDRDAVEEAARAAARWVEAFAAPSYGPHGGHKVVVAPDGPILVRSGAMALQEVRAPVVGREVYQGLAGSVQAAVGDAATGSVLLAARLVAGAHSAMDAAVPLPAVLEGLRLAHRQASAVLASLARPAPPERALASVAPSLADAADAVVRGLGQLGRGSGGAIDLDSVDVRAEPASGVAWLDGLVATPQRGPPALRMGDAGVLLVEDGWRMRPRTEGAGATIHDAAGHLALTRSEEARRSEVVDRLDRFGLGLVACRRDLDESVADRLAGRGVHVWTDVPRSAFARLAAATAARPVPTLGDAASDHIGRADIERRPRPRGGLLVNGPGPSATLVLPALTATERRAATDDGERLLRAAGAYLALPLAVPGGGRWQRRVASSLRAAADAAPAKAPFGLRLAARAIDALADDLVRNAGLDPLARPHLPGADGILDPLATVRLAMTSAFDTAQQILRVDGRHAKRPSSGERLRGGPGHIGSPKGMPGDVPPLM